MRRSRRRRLDQNPAISPSEAEPRGSETPSPLAAHRAGRHPLSRSRRMDEALLHTISRSHSWPVRTTGPWRVSSLHKKRHFLSEAERLLACIQLALQFAVVGRGRFSSPVRRTKNLESRFSGLDLTQPFQIPPSRQRNLWKNLALEPQRFGNALHWSRRNLGPKKFGGFAGGGDRKLADRRAGSIDLGGRRGARPQFVGGTANFSTERALYSPF